MSNIISLYLSSFDTNTLGIANGINADPTSVSPNSSITINVNQGDTIQWLLSSQSDPNDTFSIDQYNALPSIFSTYPTSLTNGWQVVFNDSCPTGVYRVQINWSTTSGGITQSSWASIYFNVATALLPQPVAPANPIQIFMSFDKSASIGIDLAGNLGSLPLNVPVAAGDNVEFLLSRKTINSPEIEYRRGTGLIVPTDHKNGWSTKIGSDITQLDINIDYVPDNVGHTGYATIRINAS